MPMRRAWAAGAPKKLTKAAIRQEKNISISSSGAERGTFLRKDEPMLETSAKSLVNATSAQSKVLVVPNDVPCSLLNVSRIGPRILAFLEDKSVE